MFWRRATGPGAFFGLLIGTPTAVLFRGSTLPLGETAAVLKGGWISVQHTLVGSMAQSFWMAIFAFTGCFAGTIVILPATAPNHTDEQLRGLVYSLTEKPTDEHGAAWYARPLPLGLLILADTLGPNIIFR